MKIRKKKKEMDLIKLKSFRTAKEATNKMKGQSSKRKKIIANEANDKGFIFKIHKQLNTQNKQPNQKVGRRPKQTFLYLHTGG